MNTIPNIQNQFNSLRAQQLQSLSGANTFGYSSPIGAAFGNPNLNMLGSLMQAFQSVFNAFAAFAGGGGFSPNPAGAFGAQVGGPLGVNGGAYGGPQQGGGSANGGAYGGPQQGGGSANGGAYGGPQQGGGSANGGAYGGPQQGGGTTTTRPQNLNELSQADQTRTTAHAAGLLNTNFDRIDSNRDGVISANEINLFKENQANAPLATQQALGNLGGAVPELMFGTIQSGDPAWFGLSKADLALAQRQLEGGSSLEDIQRDTRSRVISERNIPFNGRSESQADAFRTYVEQQRARVLR